MCSPIPELSALEEAGVGITPLMQAREALVNIHDQMSDMGESQVEDKVLDEISDTIDDITPQAYTEYLEQSQEAMIGNYDDLARQTQIMAAATIVARRCLIKVLEDIKALRAAMKNSGTFIYCTEGDFASFLAKVDMHVRQANEQAAKLEIQAQG